MNPQKSVGMWFVGWTTTPEDFGAIIWNATLGGYLGVSIDPQELATSFNVEKDYQFGRGKAVARAGKEPLFSRAHICDFVIYPAVLPKAQAICCPGAEATRIHRRWMIFFWMPSME